MTEEINMKDVGRRAKAAARALRLFDTSAKNRLVLAIAEAIEDDYEIIQTANHKDVEAAKEGGMSNALLDRLNLQFRLESMIDDVRSVAKLPDPVGEEYDHRVGFNGLRIHKRRVPVGVLGVIYESRPNVTVDVAVLALKSGNACILRGGKETFNTNMALVKAIQNGLQKEGFPAEAVQYIESIERRYIYELLKMYKFVDMIIPRGGAALHEFCRENSLIPVIIGGMGICHLYVDETADFDAAVEVIHNAKTQRPSVCNALDTLIIKREIAKEFVPRVIERLSDHNVTFKLDPQLSDMLNGDPKVQLAGEGDWDIEWLDYILGIKVVDSLDEAIDHIETHGTAHSDGILTRNMLDAERFLNEVDSAAVFVNASTRFNDGSALGLGAEVAVSTQKLHARGPMALQELTTYKWIIEGEGHIRV